MTKPPPKTFNVWATSDAHIVREELGEGCDPDRKPRKSMEVAIDQAEGSEGFQYDIGFHLGDILDYDHETAENFQKFRQQLSHSKNDPHYWYHLGGNNDENSVLNDGVEIDNEYYRKYIDPAGEFTDTSGIDNNQRPFPIDGTYERYSFDVGNIRFLCISDRNDLPAPYGRGEGGFFVDGAITLESFQWLVRQIITYPDRILVVACHHPLKDTTIATGIDESSTGQYMTKFNPAHKNQPTNRLQSTLHQIYPICEFDTPLFSHLLEQNSGQVDIWMSGHVHHRVEETYNGRGKYARAFGGHHFNIGNLCRYRHFINIMSAQSTLFSWTEGESKVLSRVYVHDHPTLPIGFYEPEARQLEIKKPFRWEFQTPQITAPDSTEINFQTDQTCLRWTGECTGIMIIKSQAPELTFRPVDGDVYYAGQEIPDGEVIFMGTARDVTIDSSNENFYALSYNAGNGQICYSNSDPIMVQKS